MPGANVRLFTTCPQSKTNSQESIYERVTNAAK